MNKKYNLIWKAEQKDMYLMYQGGHQIKRDLFFLLNKNKQTKAFMK